MSKIFKVAYGAGHGINTAGKRSPDGEREWSFNNKVINSFEKEMKKYENVELMRTDDPTGKTDVPLRTRTNKANNWGADVYLSSHHNAYKSKWGEHTGTEVFYSKGSVNGKKLAGLVHKGQLEAYGLRDRGLKTNNLHITRETRMPAVLIEGGFMDSTIDINKLRDDKVLERAGINAAKSVAEYGGLKLKGGQIGGSSKPSSPKPKPTPKPSKKSVAEVAREVRRGIWGNNPKRKQALEKAGYDYSVIQAEVNRQEGVDVTKPTPAPKPTGTIKTGSKVKIKTSAKTYSTGEIIPTGRKNKTYTVQQTGSKGALIKELYSWVRTGDLTLVSGGGTSAPKPSQSTVKVGQTVTVNRLYTTESSTKNVRGSSIRGYVDRINNNARNPIRLRNKKGGYYLGFTRKQDIK